MERDIFQNWEAIFWPMGCSRIKNLNLTLSNLMVMNNLVSGIHAQATCPYDTPRLVFNNALNANEEVEK